MKYTITKNVVRIIGKIWMPCDGVCAQEVELTAHDMDSLGDIDSREDVQRWIDTHCGDFSRIVDFFADFDYLGRHVEHPWKDVQSEFEYLDAMYPNEGD